MFLSLVAAQRKSPGVGGRAGGGGDGAHLNNRNCGSTPTPPVVNSLNVTGVSSAWHVPDNYPQLIDSGSGNTMRHTLKQIHIIKTSSLRNKKVPSIAPCWASMLNCFGYVLLWTVKPPQSFSLWSWMPSFQVFSYLQVILVNYIIHCQCISSVQ